MKFEIYEYTPGWYISSVEKIDGEWYYLWKDLELHRASTGYDSCKHKQRGSAPGYYYSKKDAQTYLEAYLIKGIKMNYKIGDKVKVKDYSYSFGINNGSYSSHASKTKSLTIIQTGLTVTREIGMHPSTCDLLVTDGNGGFWFTLSRFCEPVDKKIEVQCTCHYRYFCDSHDVTDSISDETKRNLSAT